MIVKRTERGWAGHFIGSTKCRFRRNTLLEYNSIGIVISTVGLWEPLRQSDFEEIHPGGFFETMAFRALNNRYKDANVREAISFYSNWSISEKDADDKANDMHEKVVNEISNKLINGEYKNK